MFDILNWPQQSKVILSFCKLNIIIIPETSCVKRKKKVNVNLF